MTVSVPVTVIVPVIVPVPMPAASAAVESRAAVGFLMRERMRWLAVKEPKVAWRSSYLSWRPKVHGRIAWSRSEEPSTPWKNYRRRHSSRWSGRWMVRRRGRSGAF
jgi:hypothetical protein